MRRAGGCRVVPGKPAHVPWGLGLPSSPLREVAGISTVGQGLTPAVSPGAWPTGADPRGPLRDAL
jgi:hypothetical protein